MSVNKHKTKIEQMRGLISKLKKADIAYYRDDHPIMSDRDYDAAMDLLKKLEHYTRDSIQAKLLELGAKPASSVTKKTDYLIVGEKAGSKLTKAQQLGIRTLTEEEFEEMLAQ